MNSRIAALFLATLAALIACSASAADLLSRGAAPVGDYAPPPPMMAGWGGFYLGIHGGYGFSSFRDGGSALVGNPSGGLIGVTGGYNYMLAPQFLIGGEVDFAFTGIENTRAPYFGATARGQVDHMFSARARAGYAMERLLLFVTGGFAASNNSVSLSSPLTGFFGYQSNFQPGWALGGGLEYMILPRVSAKAEYLFTSTGSSRYFDFSNVSLQSGVNTSAVKAGLNYHF